MTKITPAWLDDTATKTVMAALMAEGARAWFVGGCVRDALLGIEAQDVDICIDCLPAQTLALLEHAGLKAVPTGFEHGTVTAVAEGRGFEVTTLRRDVETNGRHAVVAFSDDPAEDAARRDFTMNALYALADGSLFDPLGGMPDLKAGRVRFIGDADQRIAEDHLRILRFFRFSARYSTTGIDADGLAACVAGQDGLAALSKERVGWELRKLLGAADPAPAVAAMGHSGILAAVLEGAQAALLPVVVHNETMLGIAPDWRRRLLALGRENWRDAMRLSKAEVKYMAAAGAALNGMEQGQHVARLSFEFGAGPVLDAALVYAAALSMLPMPDLQAQIARGAKAHFPLQAHDLIKSGMKAGPAIGHALSKARNYWLAEDFTPDRAGLLSYLAAGEDGQS